MGTTLTTGAPREDLTAEEIADRLARNAIDQLRFGLRLGEHALHVELKAWTEVFVVKEAP